MTPEDQDKKPAAALAVVSQDQEDLVHLALYQVPETQSVVEAGDRNLSASEQPLTANISQSIA